ncbi:AAA family ATPase [Acidovorax sp. FJL06]|uniref:AAA family ATPase n=1 Tax=Acidovorax sp. FJL06 TaxID=2153365 RepID=UPI001F1E46E2|nr:AAA family ATPase [Acidovorax sp. FJL06]
MGGPTAPVLVVLGGLPGVGKSTVARALLAQWQAVYLRIDTIEQALRDSGAEVGTAGYRVAYALARIQLAQGLPVLVDCVNPLPVTRETWHSVARGEQVPWLDVEVVCSDAAEHRRRVETRRSDIPGLMPPSWQAVLQHDYQPWPASQAARWVVDTARMAPEQIAAEVLAALRQRPSEQSSE